eukprot:3423901-Ditylum_brightwellii.AAC.1
MGYSGDTLLCLNHCRLHLQYYSLRGSTVRPGTHFTWAAPSDQQLDLFWATSHVTADGTVVFEGAAPSSPPPALYLT